MTQAERDRLVALKKAKKKLITQKQAAEEIGITERQVRRLLRKLRRKGDQAVIHELRGPWRQPMRTWRKNTCLGGTRPWRCKRPILPMIIGPWTKGMIWRPS